MSFLFATSRMSFFCSPTTASNTANPSLAAPVFLITLPVAFHLPSHFKKQCIVNSLPEMRSNTYRTLPTTPFITINVSSSLHPSHAFITLVEMSNVFATVITSRCPRGIRKVYYHKECDFFNDCSLLHCRKPKSI